MRKQPKDDQTKALLKYIMKLKYSSIAVCIVATISAIQEGYLIIKER